MAISASCPRCSHENTYDDAQANKQVQCKICFHAFPLRADAKKPSEDPAARDKVKSGPPVAPPVVTPVKKGPPRDRDDDRESERVRGGAAPRRASRREDEDDDDDRPRARRPRDESTSAGYWVLGILGGVLLLGCCGVSSLVGYLVVGASDDVVVVDVPAPPPPAVFNNPPPFGGMPPPPVVFDGPPPIQFQPNFPQAVPKLNPANPNDFDKALAGLKNRGPEQAEAIAWFKEADPKHARQAEAAKAMEALVEEQMPQPFSNDHFFRAYFRWATNDNIPSLTRLAQNEAFTVWDNHRRQQALETLGRLKHEPAAEIIAAKLPNVFDRDAAVRGLQAMAPAGEKAVLKYLHHPDGGARSAAADLLRQYKTDPEKRVSQAVDDLGAPNDQTRALAVETLAKTTPIPARKEEVARALDAQITERNLNGNFVKALENWGTGENVPKLIDVLTNAKLGRKDVIDLLGKSRDPRAIPALAARVGNFFDGREAREALKQFGKDAEGPVIQQLGSQDRNVRMEACKLLAFVGTRQNAIPALTQAVQRMPQDRQFALEAQRSATAINARP